MERRLFWEWKEDFIPGLYKIVNEQTCTVADADAWDGNNLNFTFRRTVCPALFERWLEILALN
jgi:hypothetical protein